MGDKSGIEWTNATWNPVVGCSKVSPGCAHCYAETMHRTRLNGRTPYPDFMRWTPENAEHNVTLVPERLDQPLRWRRPRMIFVNSMSDLFHELVPDDFVARVFAVMARTDRHIFQVLTKRPERMAALLGNPAFWLDVHERYDGVPTWLPGDVPALRNVWLGTSIENRRFVGRADALRETPAAVRFISAEPLLGPLVRTPYGHAWGHWSCGGVGEELDLYKIDWLIVGGESGPGHRPIKTEWVRDLKDAARFTGTAFFFKQWGGAKPKSRGRELDGRTWDEMPDKSVILTA